MVQIHSGTPYSTNKAINMKNSDIPLGWILISVFAITVLYIAVFAEATSDNRKFGQQANPVNVQQLLADKKSKQLQLAKQPWTYINLERILP